MAVRSGWWPTASDHGGDAGGISLEEARSLIVGRRWDDAYEGLSLLDLHSPLDSKDLELLATAAHLRGKDGESKHARLRAYQIYLNSGDPRRAALCAIRIGFDQISTGELAEATGCLPASLTNCSAWVAQASALVESEEECAERGYLLIPVAYEQLVLEGDLDLAADASARAVEAARRFSDPDLLAFGLVVRGRTLTRSERAEEGLVQLDEAVALVIAGDVAPSIAGVVLASAIDTADEAFDFRRFREWVETFEEWCDLQQGMIAFQSRSLAHRATVDQRVGRWDEALEAGRRACEGLIADADIPAAAAAHYRQGEVLRLRGDLDGARVAYREASRLGVDPNPGLALLRLAEGNIGAALALIGRALGETQQRLKRAKMLPAQVEILLASGNATAAAEAAMELEEIATTHPTPILAAMAQHARGAVLLTEGDIGAALQRLRQACRVWRHFGLAHEEARSRLLIARCCRTLGDEDTATLEQDEARRIFTRLKAGPDLMQLEPGSTASTYGLTNRELEVLRLLASGVTNKSIAEELTVAVKTVDSHVGSVFTKLGVSTRAGATAFAHRHHLV
ncbi:MAG TPA: LuxR C-terminal-related transcriptional regulator [Acidimicrobiia bacterium]|nr:LuxR C-terminal-related transcriptional regulator [Acidimicrobiia bacterium]